MSRRLRRASAAGSIALAVGVLAGCTTTSSPSTSPTTAVAPTIAPAPPRLHQFLQLPVASPVSCPAGTDSSTVGRVSPWTSHVDISAFLTAGLSPATVAALGAMLRSQPLVATVYHETQRQAHEEFARLYTCSASVPASQTPASYRIVLRPGSTTTERNGIVAQLARNHEIDLVACDPSNPCVDVVRSAQATAP